MNIRSHTVPLTAAVITAGLVILTLGGDVTYPSQTVAAGLLVSCVLQRVTGQLFPSPWRALLVGLVAAIAIPFALIFLLCDDHRRPRHWRACWCDLPVSSTHVLRTLGGLVLPSGHRLRR